MFEHTCTLFHKVDGGWDVSALSGVHWEDVSAVNTQKYGVQAANTVRVFVPKSCGVVPEVEDVILRGVKFLAPAKMNDLLSAGGYRITTVDFMDYGGSMSHYEVGGR